MGIVAAKEPPMIRPLHDQGPETALAWHRGGVGAALATVVQTWGASPCPVGSQMAISGAGEMVGSVSGGCVEAAVVAEALGALVDRQSRVLDFGIADETAFAVGLSCGGRVRIMVEPVGEGSLTEALLGSLVAARAAGQPVALVTGLQGWQRALVRPGQDSGVDARLDTGRSALEDGDRFVAVHAPAPRLIVVGAVHIAQPLLAMARLCGFAAVLIDPRPAFASAARFPGEVILDDWPDAALRQLAPDARSAIVVLTHDAKLDEPALVAALATPAFYIGCLGAARTQAARKVRLRALGMTEAALARVHGPVGLDIGAETPAEIALAIMADIIRCRGG
jgi:xanthine dehydrogenase accessory factor